MKIGVLGTGNLDLELWAARRDRQVLAKALDRNIEFHQLPCFPSS